MLFMTQANKIVSPLSVRSKEEEADFERADSSEDIKKDITTKIPKFSS